MTDEESAACKEAATKFLNDTYGESLADIPYCRALHAIHVALDTHENPRSARAHHALATLAAAVAFGKVKEEELVGFLKAVLPKVYGEIWDGGHSAGYDHGIEDGDGK